MLIMRILKISITRGLTIIQMLMILSHYFISLPKVPHKKLYTQLNTTDIKTLEELWEYQWAKRCSVRKSMI
jgi:hypothetical protein